MFIGFILFHLALLPARGQTVPADTKKCAAYTVDLRTQDLRLYWQDDDGKPLRSIANLRRNLLAQNRILVFAMNGGMYMENRSPLGLFIQDGNVKTPLNTASASGNFYLRPNGVFYITDAKKAVVCTTKNFKNDGHIRYATQSGPMLLADGTIHPQFKAGSANLNIRNGVGILPDGKVLFAISKVPVNFYDFARYFKDAGCQNALYLDGFVSRAYIPQQNRLQTDGDFGVIIGVSVPKN